MQAACWCQRTDRKRQLMGYKGSSTELIISYELLIGKKYFYCIRSREHKEAKNHMEEWKSRMDIFLETLCWIHLSVWVFQTQEPSRASLQIRAELKSSREKQQFKMSFSNEAALYFSQQWIFLKDLSKRIEFGSVNTAVNDATRVN